MYVYIHVSKDKQYLDASVFKQPKIWINMHDTCYSIKGKLACVICVSTYSQFIDLYRHKNALRIKIYAYKNFAAKL